MIATQLSGSRPAAVAGAFYPADPGTLDRTVKDLLADRLDAAKVDEHPAWPKAIIAPHAGYAYSGSIAATVYNRLRPARGTVTRVVLIGPAHRLPVRGLALPTVAALDTPLGPVAVDRDAVAALADLPQVGFSNPAHAQEHCLEVHLPFLTAVLGDAIQVVPLLAGDVRPAQVTAVLDRLWGGPETLIVISSDLSHYLDDKSARRLDGETTRAIELLRPDLIADDGACGRLPIKGLLLAAQARDLRATTVDLRNSGDTHGPKDRVVGYGAWTFEPNTEARLDTAARHAALTTALKAIRHGTRHRHRAPRVATETFALPLRAPRATFVTLNKDRRLRGCIGSVAAQRPLIEDVALNAGKAAFADPRFPPVEAAEIGALDLEVSVLGVANPIRFDGQADLLAQLRPGIDGVILTDRDRRGLFLPKVWDQMPDAETFLAHLKQKAGLPADHWSTTLRVHRFSTELFGAPVRALLDG